LNLFKIIFSSSKINNFFHYSAVGCSQQCWHCKNLLYGMDGYRDC